jgi:hypothetical protein
MWSRDGRGREKISRGYLPDDLIGAREQNVPFAKGPASVPFTVRRPRRVRGRVEVFRLLAGVDEG